MVGGDVLLHTATRGRWIVIDVTDNGAMLTASEVQQLFERPKDSRGGMARGLGLYLARTMAEAAGGGLEERIGARGLTLIAELPIDPVNPKPDQPAE